MYQIIKTDGQTVAFVEELRYIRQNTSSGAFVEADVDTAQGIAVNGTPYNLTGRKPLTGVADTVAVTELTADEAEAAKAKVDREEQIAVNKAYLFETDYIVLKIAEAEAEGDAEEVTALQNQYAPELAKRKQARAVINDLQAADEVAGE